MWRQACPIDSELRANCKRSAGQTVNAPTQTDWVEAEMLHSESTETTRTIC
jgi:hypothetical protein